MNDLPAQKKLDKLIEGLDGRRPKLLLHACCAPCSSYVMEYLTQFFDLVLYFYNPNMDTLEEYKKRAEELNRLAEEMPLQGSVSIVTEEYGHEAFEEMAAGLEEEPERGRRCLKCYELRLRKAAEYMKKTGGFDFFATTLTLSPLKNADAINRIGKEIEQNNGVIYLETDFKKRNGYLRSLELSKEYGLYRQDYCGCKYSKRGK